MRIQYFSDIHLEFGECEFPLTDADVVVAAGDISVDVEAIDWLAQAKCPVIYIAGNHEYYGGDLIHTRKRIVAAANAAKIDYLECSEVHIDDVRFLGATLWTDYADADDDVMDEAEQGMNDYNYIAINDKPLEPADLLQIHQESLTWLEQALAKPFAGKTVVVTHHAPTLKSWYAGRDDDDLRQHAYCNELEPLIKQHDIAVWFHGHIHCVADYRVGNTRVLCNPRGYHGYQDIEGYDPARIIEI